MIVIKKLPLGILIKQVFRTNNKKNHNFYHFGPRDIDHKLINQIRHKAVEGYEDKIKEFTNDWDYMEYYIAVQREIAKEYPMLSETIERQIAHKEKTVLMAAL